MTDSLYLKWRRVRWTVLQFVLLAALAGGLAMCTSGCFEAIPPTVHIPAEKTPAAPVVAPKPGSIEAKEHELAEAEAVVGVRKSELADLRLAPLRASLLWAEGISLLGMLAGFGLAAAALFWGLGFTWKIPAGIAVCFGAVLVTALAAGAALNHLGLIVGAIGILAAAGIAWLAYRHLSVVDAARKAWDAVPDAAPVEAKAEALLDRLMKAKGA